MNYAIIFAGGVGNRMQNGALPKQFLELNNKPIIIYTLDQFEMNEAIDGIVVVCVSGWEDYLQKKIDLFGIKKVVKILTGGSSAIESQFIGLDYINKLNQEDSIVLLHDGVRPLIDQKTINDNVKCVQERGSAITVVPAIETISFSGEEGKITELIDRDKCLMARAPQSYLLKNVYNAHLKAQAENRTDFIDSATMMEHYGYDLYTVEGSTKNIKVTTPMDYYIFKAILDAQNNEQVFGGM
ncbi:IspD/TarI family cytidylyltransferase [Latilactobacillus curvatus]|uniref:IspD/TarI family cytidylyltransferase n=1 Tax=Latilactobacillus curvatus TaxID=28038 RepID=UPI0024115693|nr:IspD/TarI family cytidylyltransferase [Latilactobacillus curvatus]MDG2978942.1 2-C-methyl-D-erythritol 4-phosphate cytidylyltransferase [Latilactobacillus curvatus]WIE01240.1 IspD/TarI family cytidylyltransferase [Latilactobacillus curvatus]